MSLNNKRIGWNCDVCKKFKESNKYKHHKNKFKHLICLECCITDPFLKDRICSICKKVYATENNKNVHLWSFHDIKMNSSFKIYKCNQDKCDKEYKNKVYLIKHL